MQLYVFLRQYSVFWEYLNVSLTQSLNPYNSQEWKWFRVQPNLNLPMARYISNFENKLMLSALQASRTERWINLRKILFSLKICKLTCAQQKNLKISRIENAHVKHVKLKRANSFYKIRGNMGNKVVTITQPLLFHHDVLKGANIGLFTLFFLHPLCLFLSLPLFDVPCLHPL